MSDTPWYREGLRFQCTGCGSCCTGAPGYVWVTRIEIAAMATALNMDEEQFGKRYVRRVGNRYSLKELAGGDCIFFAPEPRTCRLYRHRPRQCRTWPFWASNLRLPQAWDDMAAACPGANRGRLYTLEEILEHKAVVRV